MLFVYISRRIIFRRVKFMNVFAYRLLRCITHLQESTVNIASLALRRAAFKFPGRQKVFTSNKWGFTPFTREEYKKWQAEGRIVSDGVCAKWLAKKGPLSDTFPLAKDIHLPVEC